jgi:putative flippase GtrA
MQMQAGNTVLSAGQDDACPAVEIVVPVFNEERDLARSIRRLHAFLTSSFPFSTRVSIADNGSTDGTWAIATRLAGMLAGVRALRVPEAGRGRALHRVWSTSDAEVVAYMDVDLSTDLAALLPLVAPLLSGHSDLAIGTRLSGTARVVRGVKREVISRSYNAVLHAVLATRFSDAQCGFKAIRADRARTLLPYVQDGAWFFDTELLVLAERLGLRIHEVPVDWVDDPDSRVDVVRTAARDLRGVARLVRQLAGSEIPVGELQAALGLEPARPLPASLATPAAQVLSFAGIGAVSTLAYVGLYLLARASMSAQAANALALLATALPNIAANRYITFGIRGLRGSLRHQARGLMMYAAALLVTSGALDALHVFARTPGRLPEVGVLLVANLAATALRLPLMRAWVFQGSPPSWGRAPQPRLHPDAQE